ncbi:MAG: tRNA (adenine-N1)-methyltransferase [Nanoarchaeota archaeon]|nr:tRNA (adenine-N1)-methyltransferase [Nanoarchaeota archaeon]MBU1631937.1 tRNA (adenine-N1)-methyltransferase [Nanoarchaeota archaeon]MBU1875675.1 tRNA (adenine-N1)-methyltransferase [Nanoarchaeota archaeon]
MARMIKKILIEQKTNKKFYVKDLEEDFHTSFGIIKSKEIKSKNVNIRSNKGNEFLSLNPSFADLWENLKRGPQVIIQKDIGMIIAKTGINNNSKIVDAGGGSGSLCLSLANICKEITVYEINPEHYDIIQKNINLFGILNITLKQSDVYKGIQEKDVDLITLDLPEPWQVIEHAEKALKLGGHLVIYLPNLNQVKRFIDSTKKSKIKIVETIELLERKWKISDNIMRPEFEMLGHTGFLTFCRRF